MLCSIVGMFWQMFAEALALATGLHYSYPKDKQRAQEVKEKLLAEHDVEAHGAHSQPHQVATVSYAVLQSHALHSLAYGLSCMQRLHTQYSPVCMSGRLTPSW